jgi:glycosyltransferase involved in cell wall biosynthesis
MHNSKPLVSVIIPTFNRPQFLPRAVNSALAGMDSKDIEVIVVPNGPDQSWRESIAPFKHNPSVRVIPISDANANIARNTGMASARGEFIRFLDDDDYLYPTEAMHQYDLLLSSMADVCSGPIQMANNKNLIFGTWFLPVTSDFIEGALGSKRMLQVTGHVFRYGFVKEVLWNPLLSYSQDIDWTLRLCARTEVSWVKIDEPVGVWYRHTNKRISTKAPLHFRKKIVAEAILSIASLLENQGRLSSERSKAAASGIWDCVHSAYFINPYFWIKTARKARNIDLASTPDIPLYDYPLIKKLGLNPLFWESVIIPKRLVYYAFNRALLKLRLSSKW